MVIIVNYLSKTKKKIIIILKENNEDENVWNGFIFYQNKCA